LLVLVIQLQNWSQIDALSRLWTAVVIIADNPFGYELVMEINN
jgi:hypothetical protein